MYIVYLFIWIFLILNYINLRSSQYYAAFATKISKMSGNSGDYQTHQGTPLNVVVVCEKNGE